MSIQIGQILDDKYRVIREIGSGSMGAVYEGENLKIHRRVAIKVLHPGVAGNASTVQRFEREAQAAGRIGSDHIVEVLDLGALPDGSYYMVMEFLEGTTLRERLQQRGRLQPREVVPVVQQLLTGLEAAHDAHIVHRDLKPDNVFLLTAKAGQSDFVKILDFGVSKFSPLNTEDGLDLTKAGTVVGTPFYMSPEQAKGSAEIDARSDLYSVGIILYECITGQKPFDAGTFNELIFKIVLEAPSPPEQFVPDLDPAFARIVRKAMARPPEDRYQTAAEMRQALSVWLHTGHEELAATQVMEPLPPPPAPGRDVSPPPQLHHDPYGPRDPGGTPAAMMDPTSEPATCVVERPPPPPLLPHEARVAEGPLYPTDMPGAPAPTSYRAVAVAVVVTVVALTAGGVAAILVTSAEPASRSEPAALAPGESAAQASPAAQPTTSGADAPVEPSGAQVDLDEVPPDEPGSADRPPTASAADAATAPVARAGSPARPSTSPGASPATKPPRGQPTASESGASKGKSSPGRSIATEL